MNLLLMQVLSAVASVFVVCYAITFRHPIVFCAGVITLLYSMRDN